MIAEHGNRWRSVWPAADACLFCRGQIRACPLEAELARLTAFDGWDPTLLETYARRRVIERLRGLWWTADAIAEYLDTTVERVQSDIAAIQASRRTPTPHRGREPLLDLTPYPLSPA